MMQSLQIRNGNRKLIAKNIKVISNFVNGKEIINNEFSEVESIRIEFWAGGVSFSDTKIRKRQFTFWGGNRYEDDCKSIYIFSHNELVASMVFAFDEFYIESIVKMEYMF